MIAQCTCAHPFQDKEYGRGLRVHNDMVKDNKVAGRRCTVCGAKKDPPKAAEVKR